MGTNSHILTKGFHTADEALPRRLPLLHVRTPAQAGERAYMTLDEVLESARAADRAGCREALFTLGDKPELRYRHCARGARRARVRDRRSSTSRRLREPFSNRRPAPAAREPGRHDRADFDLLRPVSASMGLMLEIDLGAALSSAAARTSARPTRRRPRGSRRSGSRAGGARCRSRRESS